jgi:hypothetical protein
MRYYLELAFRFFERPLSSRAVALFRVVFGLLAVWTGLGILLNLERYWGPNGVLPWAAAADLDFARWSLCALFPDSMPWLWTLGGVFTAAALTATLGVAPRSSCFVLFVAHVSFQHRNPYILNSGDRLFAIIAGLAVLLPLGRHWSLSSWFRERALGRAREQTPEPSGWMQRLIMCQIAYVYWFSVLAKLRNPEWIGGYAIQNVLASPIYSEWPMWIPSYLSLLLSWSTLVFEFSFPIVVWLERWRRKLLVAGLFFHLGIEITMTIPMFSAIMLTTYALFLTDADFRDIARLGARLRGAIRAR